MMQGLFDFLSQFLTDNKFLIGIILLIVALDYGWSRFAASERWLRFAILMRPKDAEAHFNLGTFLSQKSEHDAEAEMEIRQAIALAPRMLNAYYRLAGILENRKADKQEIDDFYTEMRVVISDDPALYMFYGLALENLEYLSEAEQAYRQAISFAPRLPALYEYLGRLLIKQTRYAEAQEALAKTIELDGYTAYRQRLRGAIFEELEKYPEAEKEYWHAIALNSKYSEPYGRLFVVFKQQERYLDAEKILEKGIKLNPQAVVLKVMLADNFYLQGNKPKAMEVLNEIASLESNDVNTFNWIGNLFSALNAYSEAEMSYRNAIRQDPTFVWAYTGLAEVFMETAQYKESEELCFQAIALDDKNVDAVFKLGYLYLLHLKRYKDADDAFQKVTELDPENVTAFYNVACANSLLQNKDRALAYLKTAIEKGFDAAFAREDPDLEWLRNDPSFAEIVGPKPE